MANLLFFGASDPDEAAEQQAIARELCWPLAAVQADPDGARSALATQRAHQALADTPGTKEWLGAHAANAALGLPQVGRLTMMEWLLRQLFPNPKEKGNWGGDTFATRFIDDLQGHPHGTYLLHQNAWVTHELSNIDSGFHEFGLATMEHLGLRSMDAPEADWQPPRFAQALATRSVELTNLQRAPDSVGDFVGSFSPYLLSGVFAPLTVGASAAHRAHVRALADGRPNRLEENRAIMASGLTGGALAAVPVGGILERLTPALKNPVQEYLRRLGVQVVGGATTGGAMAFGENAVHRATIDPGQDLTEGVAANAGQMALLSAIFHVVGRGAEESRTVARVEAFDAVARAARESRLPETAPRRFADLAKQISGEAKVFVPAGRLRAAIAERMTPQEAEAAVQALGRSPGRPETATRYAGGSLRCHLPQRHRANGSPCRTARRRELQARWPHVGGPSQS